VAPGGRAARLREDLGQDASALDGLAANPLPGAFELALAPEQRSPAELRALADRVAALPGVSEVRWGEPWVEGYAKVVRVAELSGVGLGVFLLVVLGAIVASTVRLSLHARTDEIQIQRPVGAGRLCGCGARGGAAGRLRCRASPCCAGCCAGSARAGDAVACVGGQPARFFGPAEAAALVGGGGARARRCAGVARLLTSARGCRRALAAHAPPRWRSSRTQAIRPRRARGSRS
jgi:hypothetical protein